MTERMHGSTIVVTGAGSGIGAATAVALASRGSRLLLVGRRASRLEQVAQTCSELASDVETFATDVSLPDTPHRIVELCRTRFGSLHGIVNAAAVARFGSIEAVSDDDARSMFEINLLAPLRLIRAAVPLLAEVKGAVVNVSSIGGVLATPNRAMYGALKAALSHLTRSLARELAPRIRVNAIVPGAVDTPMYQELGLAPAESEALRTEMIKTTPAGRMGMPTDVAPWVCHLLEPSAGWVTGSLLSIDGGRSA